jgi:hypothetical protein
MLTQFSSASGAAASGERENKRKPGLNRRFEEHHDQ